jgi:hypothetical protein
MADRLLYKNSCNITSLINLITIHEETTARYLRHQNTNDANIVNLLNNVLTHSNPASRDISLNTIELIHNDNTLNQHYLNQLKFADLSYCVYTTCPISQDAFTDDVEIIQIKTCGHYFKKDAFMPWLRQSRYCPYCRALITNQDTSID